jgi:hypothetical protein
MSQTTNNKPSSALPALLFVIAFRVLMILYWLARYGGNWAEDDQSRTTASIDAVFRTGALVPKDRFLYANGFLYQVFGTVLAQFTGLSVVDVQRWLMPMLGIVLTAVAFVFYLRIFRNSAIAAVVTTLLNLQGDFLYATLRSSHEKIDFLLIFVSLLVLVLSVQWFESWRERVALAAVYYFVILAENTNNVFFASTFTITLILSFLFWYGLIRYTRRRMMGLGWVIGAAIFAFLVTFILVTFISTDIVITSETLFRTLFKWFLVFFAVFIAGLLTIFFVQGWHWREMITEAAGASWLLYVAIVSIVFVFIVIFVWYSPARSVVAVTGDITDRIRLFMVSPISEPGGLLKIVSASWVFPNAWLWLRIYDIVIMLTAGIGWIYLIWRLRSAAPSAVSPVGTGTSWLLILLPAFALQNMLFVLSDLTGSVGDINNLQIRLIPFTALVAVPTAVYTLIRFLSWLRTRRTAYKLVSIGLVIATALALVLGLIKGTSEPLLSNAWFFYAPAERSGVAWLNQAVPQFDFELGRRTPTVWTGHDFRIGRFWLEQFWGSSRNILPLTSSLNTQYTYVFISPGVRMLSERYSQPIPDLQAAGLIYDNGVAKIYYRPQEK